MSVEFLNAPIAACDPMWMHTAHRREHCAMFLAHRRGKLPNPT